ncbi:MAG: serine/threonine-protein kinase [Polyangia bacterium]
MRWPGRIGRWDVKQLLGSGGVAEVLLGVDPASGEQAALKRCVAERADDPVQAAALRVEAYLLGRLHHPNVVQLVELIDGPAPVVALERLHGCTLGVVLGAESPNAVPERFEPLDLRIAIEIAAQAAAALVAVHGAVDESLHALEAVHRDVSPENLFVTVAGIVKLFDFNVSFLRGHTEAPVPGAMQGRVAYMAPEQARGEHVTGHADVFSLGVVLWETVVGERLFWRGNKMATLHALLHEPVRRASERRAVIPRALDDLLVSMLDVDPLRRPSALELERHLRALEPTDRALRERLASLAAQRP